MNAKIPNCYVLGETNKSWECSIAGTTVNVPRKAIVNKVTVSMNPVTLELDEAWYCQWKGISVYAWRNQNQPPKPCGYCGSTAHDRLSCTQLCANCQSRYHTTASCPVTPCTFCHSYSHDAFGHICGLCGAKGHDNARCTQQSNSQFNQQSRNSQGGSSNGGRWSDADPNPPALPIVIQLEAAQRIYRRLAAKYHPDRFTGDPAIMSDLNELWQSVLKGVK